MRESDVLRGWRGLAFVIEFSFVVHAFKDLVHLAVVEDEIIGLKALCHRFVEVLVSI